MKPQPPSPPPRKEVMQFSNDRTSVTTYPVRGFLLDEATFHKICMAVARVNSPPRPSRHQVASSSPPTSSDSGIEITAEWRDGRATFSGFDSFRAYRSGLAYDLLRLSVQTYPDASDDDYATSIRVAFRSCWLSMRPVALTVTAPNLLVPDLLRNTEGMVRTTVLQKRAGGRFFLWKSVRPKLRHKIKRWFSSRIGRRLGRWMAPASFLLALAGFLLTLYLLLESCRPEG